ncbi:hypothetical protein DRQ53_13655, partial [bacterium]
MPEVNPVHLVFNPTSGVYDSLNEVAAGDRLLDIVYQSDYTSDYALIAKQGSGVLPTDLAVGPNTLVGRAATGGVVAFVSGSGSLQDVLGTGRGAAKFLKGDGTWDDVPSSVGVLTDLLDVTLGLDPNDPADGEYLRFDEGAPSKWTNAPLSIVDDSSPVLGGHLDTGMSQVRSMSGSVDIRGNTTQGTPHFLVNYSDPNAAAAWNLTFVGKPVPAMIDVPSPGTLPFFLDATGGRLGGSGIFIDDAGGARVALQSDDGDILIDGIEITALSTNVVNHGNAGSPHGAHATLTGGDRLVYNGGPKIPLRQLGDIAGALGTGLFLKDDGTWAVPGVAGGDITSAVNWGTGVGIYNSTSAGELRFLRVDVGAQSAEVLSIQEVGASPNTTARFDFDIDGLTNEITAPEIDDWVLVQEGVTSGDTGRFVKVKMENLPGSGSGASTLVELSDVDFTPRDGNSGVGYLRAPASQTEFTDNGLTIVDDSLPKLGGPLDANGQLIFDAALSLRSQTGDLTVFSVAGDVVLVGPANGRTFRMAGSGSRKVTLGGPDNQILYANGDVIGRTNMLISTVGTSSAGTVDLESEITAVAGTLSAVGNGVDTVDQDFVINPFGDGDVKVGRNSSGTGSLKVQGTAPRIFCQVAGKPLIIENVIAGQDVSVLTDGGNLTVNGVIVPAVTLPVSSVDGHLASWIGPDADAL